MKVGSKPQLRKAFFERHSKLRSGIAPGSRIGGTYRSRILRCDRVEIVMVSLLGKHRATAEIEPPPLCAEHILELHVQPRLKKPTYALRRTRNGKGRTSWQIEIQFDPVRIAVN